MNRSTPGLHVHHQLPESTQTHVHRVGEAIQPSHPLLSPFPPALNLSQHQGLFKCQLFTSGGQSIGVSLLGLNSHLRLVFTILASTVLANHSIFKLFEFLTKI